MAEMEASLLRQCPLLLPQNRAKTVYEGFISVQVPARLLPARYLGLPLAAQLRPWKSVTGAVSGPDLWGSRGAAQDRFLRV